MMDGRTLDEEHCKGWNGRVGRGWTDRYQGSEYLIGIHSFHTLT